MKSQEKKDREWFDAILEKAGEDRCQECGFYSVAKLEEVWEAALAYGRANPIKPEVTKNDKKRVKEYAESCDNESGGFLTHQLEAIREKAYRAGMFEERAKQSEDVRELVSEVDKIIRNPVYSSHKAIAAWKQVLKKFEAGK